MKVAKKGSVPDRRISLILSYNPAPFRTSEITHRLCLHFSFGTIAACHGAAILRWSDLEAGRDARWLGHSCIEKRVS